MQTYTPSSDPHVGEQMGEKMASSATTTGRSTLPTGGAKIVGGHNGEGPGPQVMAAHTLEGDPVVNRRGEKLGEIREIMIDVPSGRVVYVVLSFGGFQGMGDKLFAIPWNALSLDAVNKRFILDVPKERVQGAPGFDKYYWPSMLDQRWGTEIHSYYGTQPYWKARS